MMKESSQNRQIRSYVKREGRITANQAHALQTLWSKYGLTTHMNCSEYMENTILEIGFGMGDSLLKMAMDNPDQKFVGVEVHRPGVGALLDLIEKHKIENVRIFNEDIISVLNQSINNETLSKIQIFFPDPWPKRRHRKRRLIQTDFIVLLCQKLKKDGHLHLATDVEDYAEQMMQILSDTKHLMNCAGAGNYLNNQNLRPMTKFERRGQRLGHGTWDLFFQIK